MLTRRQFIRTSGIAALAANSGLALGSSLTGCSSKSASKSSSGKGVVNVVTWGDPQKSKLMGAAFKEQTGINLNLIPGLDDEDFYNKVRYGGGGQYDVVITNIGWAPLYEREGLVEILDLSTFPAADELYPEFRADPRFTYLKGGDRSLLFPDQWGLYAMTYSTITPFKVSKPYSWEELWKAPKGTVVLDGFYVVDMAVAARMTGVPWNKVFAVKGKDLDPVVERLRALKPFQMPSSMETQINNFRTKQADIGLIFSLGFASDVAAQVGQNIAISVLPEEGAIGALDGQMLIKGARNRENALKWINFLGGKQAQEIFWQLYKGPTANKLATEAIIAKGGADAALMKAQGGNNPQLAAVMTEVQQPADPQAWNLAWDRVLAK
jgi:spermidine/putrescine transport system substrate-binding protein